MTIQNRTTIECQVPVAVRQFLKFVRDKDFDELQNEQSLEECHQAVNTAEPMDEDDRSHSAQQAEDLVEDLDERVSDNDNDAQSSLLPVSEVEICQSLCCSEIIKPFHPTDKKQYIL